MRIAILESRMSDIQRLVEKLDARLFMIILLVIGQLLTTLGLLFAQLFKEAILK